MRLFASVIRRRKASDKELKEAIKNLFGYQAGNVALYRLAFRHKSAVSASDQEGCHNNERLEYLGDAVLGSIVADFLFKKFPYKDEGFLTEMRSRIVSRSHLNQLSRKLGIDRLVQTSKENNIAASSILGDAFEALVGAIYLDKGYRFTQKIIVEKIFQTHVDLDALFQTEMNFKSKVIEWAQKERKNIEFLLARESENGKKGKLYYIHLFVGGRLLGEGCDQSIKKAEQHAARKACEILFDESTL